MRGFDAQEKRQQEQSEWKSNDWGHWNDWNSRDNRAENDNAEFHSPREEAASDVAEAEAAWAR